MSMLEAEREDGFCIVSLNRPPVNPVKATFRRVLVECSATPWRR